MVFPLEWLALAVDERADVWTGLGMSWQALPVQPNYGKPVIAVHMESAAWLVEVMIWVSGEAELATIRMADDRVVNKHYDLADRHDLEVLLDELVSLLINDHVPGNAVVFHEPAPPV